MLCVSMSATVFREVEALGAGGKAGRFILLERAGGRTAFRRGRFAGARCLPSSRREAWPARQGQTAEQLAGWRSGMQVGVFMLRRKLLGFDWLSHWRLKNGGQTHNIES